MLVVFIFMSLTQVLEVKNIKDSFQKLELIPTFGDFMVKFGILCPITFLISHILRTLFLLQYIMGA